MSTIVVTQSHSLDAQEAKRRLGAFESDIAKYGMKLAWSGTRADLKGTGASGDVVVTGADVKVTVKLGLLAKAAGIKPDLLEKSIAKRLVSALAPEGS